MQIDMFDKQFASVYIFVSWSKIYTTKELLKQSIFSYFYIKLLHRNLFLIYVNIWIFFLAFFSIMDIDKHCWTT